MQLKQVWNKKVAEVFDEMDFDEQAKYYRAFKKQFETLNQYNTTTSNELFYQYLEETIMLACNGDVVAQDFLAYIYKKGREGIFEPSPLRAYKWGIIATANGSKISAQRLKFFFQPAFYIIAEHPKLDEIIENYNLTSDIIEFFFANALSDMIMSASDVNLKEMSKLPIEPQNGTDEGLRELERIRNRVIENMMNLL